MNSSCCLSFPTICTATERSQSRYRKSLPPNFSWYHAVIPVAAIDASCSRKRPNATAQQPTHTGAALNLGDPLIAWPVCYDAWFGDPVILSGDTSSPNDT